VSNISKNFPSNSFCPLSKLVNLDDIFLEVPCFK
jgi:hypothetical protein